MSVETKGVGTPTPSEETPVLLRDVIAECDPILALTEQAQRLTPHERESRHE